MTAASLYTLNHESGVRPANPTGNQANLDSLHRGVIATLKQRAGREEAWHLAVLRAMGQWTITREHVAGRVWHYIIGGEALDGLTLAQRLCLEIPDVVPHSELQSLLFRGQWPERITPERLRDLIGSYRYTALLNFRYGIVVEETLQLVAEESIRKNRLARCYQDGDQVIQEAYRHLYGDTQSGLLAEFFATDEGKQDTPPESLSLTQWHEFTYWLFKRRVSKSHPARVASDTRRGLERLRELYGSGEHDAMDCLTGAGHIPLPSLTGRTPATSA